MYLSNLGRRGATQIWANASTKSGVLGALPTRALSASADPQQEKKAKKLKQKAVHSVSFVQNVFRGLVEPEQTFPFPKVLNEDQMDTLNLLVPPTEKFMVEVNDPLKNDADAQVPEDVIQVRQKYESQF